MKEYGHIAFTICSNNYLGQALALKKSFLKHNPAFGFYIILVDKLSTKVDYTLFEPATVVPFAAIEGVDVEDLVSRYYIIELNTAIKPSVFKHLIRKHPKAKNIYYLDPDLYFYDSLEETNRILQTKTAVLTPHILSPIPRDGNMPDENIFLRFGIYNLGFIGLSAQSSISHTLLDWWEERTLKFGYDRPQKGYFVDQLWMVHAPLFFENIEILSTYNYNMAPWNLHERSIKSINGDKILLSDTSRLCFYHFSKLAHNKTDISREYNRFTLQDFPLLNDLYAEYRKVLENCNFYEYKKIPIAYNVRKVEEPVAQKKSFFKKVLLKSSNLIIRLANKL